MRCTGITRNELIWSPLHSLRLSAYWECGMGAGHTVSHVRLAQRPGRVGDGGGEGA
jgi:hypothetical protein